MRKEDFKSIYKENYPKVMRLCLGYVNGDNAQAQDLAQDVFIKVWENLKTFRNESSLSTWVYKITVNTCLLHLRSTKKLKISNYLPFNLESQSEHVAENKESQFKQLYTCINKLNDDNKAIILLELEGLPQKAIAEIIGINHDALRVRIHRIKNELTKCVTNE
ncbi:RNA polymerase sigma factor [Winogradskyella forsetii]|uniref:RNA polymerase sigma factor n=1 Tax=Winogradskyella forsetii TaxID=2686077 RepID=UPI0015B7A5CC|nr:sigma-70 family RNA polymerase sigma factor [Winogradskyella forsetii]